LIPFGPDRRQLDRHSVNVGTWPYRALFALRHPKAIGLWHHGVDYDSYGRLDRKLVVG
jgi:hypothetical protein